MRSRRMHFGLGGKRALAMLGILALLACLETSIEGGVMGTSAAASPGLPGAKPPPGPKIPDDPAAVKESDQLVAFNQIRDLVEQNANDFAGVSAQGPASLTVYKVEQPSALGLSVLSKIQSAASSNGITLQVAARARSLSELKRLDSLVRPDGKSPALGSAILGVEIDTDANALVVTVREGDVPTVGALATKLFGDAITIRGGELGVDSSNRQNDVSPWWGGNLMTSGSTKCSSGFSIRNLYNTQYMITGGHCFTINTVIFNGGVNMGSVKFLAYPGNPLDDELVGGSVYDAFIYGGPPGPPNSFFEVHSSRDSCGNGCSIYLDGALSGQKLTTETGPANFCYQFPSGYSCGLQRVTTGLACQAGDSGGPAFAYDGNNGGVAPGIIAVGLIKGSIQGQCVYTSVPQILQEWQATIATSFN